MKKLNIKSISSVSRKDYEYLKAYYKVHTSPRKSTRSKKK